MAIRIFKWLNEKSIFHFRKGIQDNSKHDFMLYVFYYRFANLFIRFVIKGKNLWNMIF